MTVAELLFSMQMPIGFSFTTIQLSDLLRVGRPGFHCLLIPSLPTTSASARLLTNLVDGLAAASLVVATLLMPTLEITSIGWRSPVMGQSLRLIFGLHLIFGL